MAKPSLGFSTPASPFFSPCADQSAVSHLRVTVQSVVPKPNGDLKLSITSGNVTFGLVIFNLPGRPDYKPGDTLILEFPRGHNPLTDYSAIYHESVINQFPKPHLNRSISMSAIQTAQSNALIPTFQSTIGGQPALCCDGRALHTFLKNGDKFSDWIKARIDKYGFEQGNDFECVSQKSETQNFASEISEAKNDARGGHNRKDYHLTINMAKELSMVENNEQGKIARRYFIECESIALGQVATPKPEPKKAAKQLPPHTEAFKLLPLAFRAARVIGLDKNAAAISANQAVISITGVNVLQLYGTTHIEAERQDTQWFTPTELGKRRNLSAQALNKALETAGLQSKQGKEWELTDSGRAFARLFGTGKKHGNGVPVQQIKWSPTVLQMIDEHKEAA